jgi:O-antigen ligase/tetratricopeptide (TPR) repeat protein
MTMLGISRTPSRRARWRGQPHHASQRDEPDGLIFDAAAVIALFVVPFAVGGRHPAGYAALSIAALVACVAWLLRMLRVDEPRWTVGPGEVLLAAALVIGGIQTVALPVHVIDAASPRLHDLLPAYSGGPWSLGTWQTFSLTPGETAVGLSIVLAQGILGLVVYQFARSIESIERVLVIVAAAAAMVALHGLIQFVGHEGKNFDVATVSFHQEGGLVKAMFRNRNDFAGFLAVAAGPAVWLAFRQRETAPRHGNSRPRGRRPHRETEPAGEVDGMQIAIGLGILALISFAVFASLARGGSIALGVATALGCGMLVRSGHLRPKMGLAVFTAAAVVAIALEIHGMEQFAGRMETIVDEDLQKKQFGRQEVWEAAWQTIRAYPLTGTGIGSHGDMSRIMMPPTGSTQFVHAENSYLNLAVETGLPGLCLAVAALAAALVAAVTVFIRGSGREKPIAVAITASLVAGAVNAIGHFNWYVPAITTLLIVLGACAIRMAARHVVWIPSWRIPVPRSLAAVFATAAMILLGTVASRQITAAIAEPKWDEAVAQSKALALERRAALTAEANLSIEAAEVAEAAQQAAEQDRPDETLPPHNPSRDRLGQSAPLHSPSQDQPSPHSPSRERRDQLDETPQAPLEPPAELVQKVNAVLQQRSAVLAGLDERLKTLEMVVAARPDHPRAWAELAAARCERFGLARHIAGEAVTLVELRQVALSGGFASREACDAWLRRVIGDGLDDLLRSYEEAKRAVVHAPCSGEAWCVLANLAFLESFDAEVSRRCIEQALAVRPHDGTVLFEAARQAELDGDKKRAAALWRKCFAVSSDHRDVILNLLRTKVSAEQAIVMLDPDLAGLRAIDAAWSRQSSADAMRPVRERLLAALVAAADEASSPKQASQRCHLLCEASRLQRALGHAEQAAAMLTAAIAANPSAYAARMARVDLALALDDPDTAKQHLDWLLLRRPDAKTVQDRVNKLKQLRVRLASAPVPTTTSPDTSPTPSGAR